MDAIFKILYATEEDFVAVGAEEEGGAPAAGAAAVDVSSGE